MKIDRLPGRVYLTLVAIFCCAQAPCRADDNQADSPEVRLENVERRMERNLAISQSDSQLYEQMVRIAAWISQYCIWNRHWPEPGDQENDAVRQLNELCPNNPYQAGKVQQTEGFSTDPIYQYYSSPTNVVTGASSGFDGDSIEPTTTFGALGDKRIRMAFDPSLTAMQAKQWEEDPPDEWEAAPGTITAISNGTDLVVIWGSGYDGKPIRVPGQKRIRLFVTSVKMNMTERSNY